MPHLMPLETHPLHLCFLQTGDFVAAPQEIQIAHNFGLQNAGRGHNTYGCSASEVDGHDH